MVHSEVLLTPSYEAGKGVWTFYGSTTIDAPAAVVFRALLDFPTYHLRKLYTPTITTPTDDIRVGDDVILAYRPEPEGKTMDVPCEILEITEGEKEMRICWWGKAMGIPTWMFLPEKVQRVRERADGKGCEYEIWETQGGPMALVSKVVNWRAAGKDELGDCRWAKEIC